jgi:DNA-binding NarL/FixJ family response regulator
MNQPSHRQTLASNSISIAIIDDDDERRLRPIYDKIMQYIPNAEIHRYSMVSEYLRRSQLETLPDVVLLDVLGVGPPPTEAIPQIRDLWPRIPIIILTAYPNPQDTVDFFHMGARGYLQKAVLVPDEIPITQFQNDDVDRAWLQASELIKLAIEEYRPLKHILYDPRVTGYVRKQTGSISSPLAEQAKFLIRMSQWPDQEISSLFPEVTSVQYAPSTSYEIPLYRGKSLRRTLFESTSHEDMVTVSKKILLPLLRTLKVKLFDQSLVPVSDASDYVEEFYTGKLRRRLEQTSSLVATDPKIPAIQRSALLSLFDANHIRIGNRRLLSPTLALDSIFSNPESLDKLVPRVRGQIHGDLHFDNILVDATVPERPFIKLVDPRGFHNGGDFAYDLGKILHSCHGK